MPETLPPTKKALRQELKRVQAALKSVDPKFPSVRRTCKYCGCNFNTAATYNGSKQKFCKPAHRKAYDREGEKPIDIILRKQEKRMRQIAREEIEIAVAEMMKIAERQGFIAPGHEVMPKVN